MHKERIPMHKESGFLCRERGARGKGTAEVGARQKRVGIRTSRARETLPQHIMACQGAAVKGDIPPGGILGFPRRGVGKGGILMCGKGARDGA